MKAPDSHRAKKRTFRYPTGFESKIERFSDDERYHAFGGRGRDGRLFPAEASRMRGPRRLRARAAPRPRLAALRGTSRPATPRIRFQPAQPLEATPRSQPAPQPAAREPGRGRRAPAGRASASDGGGDALQRAGAAHRRELRAAGAPAVRRFSASSPAGAHRPLPGGHPPTRSRAPASRPALLSRLRPAAFPGCCAPP